MPSETASNATGLRIQTLLAAAAIAVEAYTAYDNGEALRADLGAIADQIKFTNNILVGGSGGPDGFAQHVLDFINLKIPQYTADGKEHRFFLYHPHTQWHGAFARLRRTQGFPHECFLGFGRDLFMAARLILSAWVALEELMGDEAKNITFHLLIPSFCTIVIPQPFQLVDALFPLTIDSEIGGGYMVWLNLPRIAARVLVDVGNLSDLPESKWKREAVRQASVLTTGAGLWGVGQLCAAAAEAFFPPLGLLASESTDVVAVLGSAVVDTIHPDPQDSGPHNSPKLTKMLPDQRIS